MRDEALQRLAFDELAHEVRGEVGIVLRVVKVEHVDHVAMLHPRGYLSLAAEALCGLEPVDARRRDNLDCHLPLELRVEDLEDFSHSALAEHTELCVALGEVRGGRAVGGEEGLCRERRGRRHR